ncbi:MAG: zinc ribbon domain-containing protein [Candidatus Parcubacteria bacterium]|nr:zinc ribbon domain-containing protein [Candidatus Parcubacteria bacterium]
MAGEEGEAMKTYEEKRCPSCGQSVAKIATFCQHCGKIFYEKCSDCGTEHQEVDGLCPILLSKLCEEFKQERWAWKVKRNIDAIAGCFLFLLLCGLFFSTPLVLGWIALFTILGFLISIFVSFHTTQKEWEEKKFERYLDELSVNHF